MTLEQIVSVASNLGMGGIVFIIWYFDMKKTDTLKEIVSVQIDDKKTLREDRRELMELLGKHATLIERTVNILDRVEQRMDIKNATMTA